MEWIKKLKDAIFGSESGIKSLEKPDGTIIQSGKEDMTLEELRKKYGGNIIGYASPSSKNVKYVAGEKTDRPAHHILVRKKKPKSELKAGEIVPASLNGSETDVIEIGDIKALGITKRFRPLKSGPSIGNIKIPAGTPGGPAQFSEGVGWCTNSHVATETIRKDLSAQERNCVQPGPVDGGKYPADYVGYVRKAYIIPAGYTAYNDFAFILADTPELFKEPLIYGLELPWLEPITSSDMAPGDKLWKPITRTTNLQVGSVVSTGATISVNYGNDGTIVHKDCLVSTAVSAGGDSGSWCGKLVEGTGTEDDVKKDVNRHPATYLFAGSSTTTIHHDILGAMFGMSISPYVPSVIPPEPPDENKVRVDFALKSDLEYTVYGTVTNNDSGSAIEGCMITIDGTGYDAVYTDDKGTYEMPDVKSGSYKVTASASGYVSQTKDVAVGTMQVFRLKKNAGKGRARV